METRHPIEGYFGNEFPSICNPCGVIAVWRCIKDVEKIEFFGIFLEKRPLQENFQNSVPKGFIATPMDMLGSNFVKFGRRKIGKIVGCLPDKKFDWPQLSLLRGSRSKCAGASLRENNLERSRFHPNRFTFGGVIPERLNTVKTGREVFPISGWSLASSRIIITKWQVTVKVQPYS